MTIINPPNQLRVLVVDDERLSRQTMLMQLNNAGFGAVTAEDGREALAILNERQVDVVVSDLRMPGMDGLALLAQVRQSFPGLDFIVMTAHGTVQTAVAAMRDGAADYLVKPFRFDELELRLRRLGDLRDVRRENRALRAMMGDAVDRGGIVGDSPSVRAALSRVRIFAGQDLPVLVTGETGTGKELVARAIHTQGFRSSGPFVAVPCGAIPGDLAESELFGHERGAFTGATSSRAGAFERADGGTLLLDDVDDMPLLLQAKLLRVLQDGSFSRVGGGALRTADVRVVATTKIALELAVGGGRFRSDLMYRLRALEIHIAPLRERGGDVQLLARHFVRLHAAQRGKPDLVLSPAASAALARFDWPGNVRELGHAIASAVAICPGDVIEEAHLPDQVRDPSALRDALVSLNLGAADRVSFASVVQTVERELIRWALAQAGGQQTKAADLLGLPRTTFQSKLGKTP